MKSRKDNTVQYNQEKVSLGTLKMNPAMLGVMGGQTKEEAISFLKSIGYTDAKIAALQS